MRKRIFLTSSCIAIFSIPLVFASAPFQIDPEFSKKDREMLEKDLEAIDSYQVDSLPDSFFSKVFSGTDSEAVRTYLDDRLSWVVSEKIAYADRFQTVETPFMFEEKLSFYAVNYSLGIWVTQLLNPSFDIFFEVGGAREPASSTRVGIIGVSEDYLKSTYPRLHNVTVLVHEARHSDCSKEPSPDDVQKLINGTQPENLVCGNYHAICPKGHDFEGLPACDAHPWGAYAVGAIYAAEVHLSCKKCSEEERQLSMALSIDSLYRLLDLEGLLQGDWGDPDMTSRGI